MRWIARIVIAVAINLVAVWAAATWIPGVTVSTGFSAILKVGLILTLLNFVLKPILKMFLGPIIVLTLGLGLIVVNAIVLYALDKLSADFSIVGVPALFYAAVFIGLINFAFHLATKK